MSSGSDSPVVLIGVDGSLSSDTFRAGSTPVTEGMSQIRQAHSDLRYGKEPVTSSI